MNILEVGKQIAVLNNLAYSYHCDIIDNHYAPAFGCSVEFVLQIKSISSLPIDVHLMVEDVERTTDMFLAVGADIITVPIEGVINNAFRIIRKIKDAGAKVGVAISPVTPVGNLRHVLPIVDKVTILMFDPGIVGQNIVEATFGKVSQLANICRAQGYMCDLEVDGSCNKENFKRMLNCGANQFVVGRSGLFRLDHDIERAWQKMKEYMDAGYEVW